MCALNLIDNWVCDCSLATMKEVKGLVVLGLPDWTKLNRKELSLRFRTDRII